MRSKKVEFRMGRELHDLMCSHAKEIGFKNAGDYITALVMHDLSHGQRKAWLKAIASTTNRTLQELVVHQLLILGLSPDDIVFVAREMQEKRKQT